MDRILGSFKEIGADQFPKALTILFLRSVGDVDRQQVPMPEQLSDFWMSSSESRNLPFNSSSRRSQRPGSLPP